MAAWTICMLVVLAAIACEDLRTRRVHIGLFAALCLLMIVHGLFLEGAAPLTWLQHGALNLVLLSVLLGLLWVYLRIRHRGRLAFSDGMGAGDVVLFVLLAFAFPAGASFLLFLIAALSFTLLAHVIVRRLLRLQEVSVATAGWVSICFGAHLLIGLCMPGMPLSQ